MATTVEERKPIGVKDLLEAGLHFGHQTKRWNPKMKRFIFDKRNGIHIIDLAKSLVRLNLALEFLHDTIMQGKSVLFVGTKKQARDMVRETAQRTNQHYVDHRWLGGTLTNSQTIRHSVKKLLDLNEMEKKDEFSNMHKKEAAALRHLHEKLRRNLTGISSMDRLPGALFVIDVNREAIAVAEANRLDIPVVAMLDTNCNPDPIEYPIPGNDDAIRAIKLICKAVGDTLDESVTEYSKIAAEIARKKEEERKEAERREAEARKAAEEREKAAREAAKAKKEAAKAKKEAEAETKKKAPPVAKSAPAAPAAEAKTAPAETAAAKPEEKPEEKPAAAPAVSPEPAEPPPPVAEAQEAPAEKESAEPVPAEEQKAENEEK